MKSFVFWLTVAAALGSLGGSLLRPGVIEIVTTFAVVNCLFYGIRNARRRPVSN